MTKRGLVSVACATPLGGGVFLFSITPLKLSNPNGLHGDDRKAGAAVGYIVPAHSVSINFKPDGIVGVKSMPVLVSTQRKVSRLLRFVLTLPESARPMPSDRDRWGEANIESAKQQLRQSAELLVENKKSFPRTTTNMWPHVPMWNRCADVGRKKRQNRIDSKAGVDNCKNLLPTSTIYAPIDGTVLNRKVEVGEPIILLNRAKRQQKWCHWPMRRNSPILAGSVSEHDAA